MAGGHSAIVGERMNVSRSHDVVPPVSRSRIIARFLKMAEPTPSNPHQREQAREAEIQALRQEIQRLTQANADLEIALATTAEHGDLVESQLHQANQQLKSEIAERRRAETALSSLLNILSRQKDDLEIILQTITEHGDVLDRQWFEQVSQARSLASLDGLTQIANRRRFDEYMEQQWRQMAREHTPLSLILCDIDFFKQYNDTYGHLAGDDCLRKIAQAIAKTLKRPADLLCRYGGEEFVALLPKTGIRGALTVAKQMQLTVNALQIPHANSGICSHITLSIGLASILPDVSTPPNVLLDEADHYLYRAKQQGRACIVHADYQQSKPVLNTIYIPRAMSSN